MPQISVILPVHNAGSFLSSAIDSVLKQTFRDFELLLIDDGSSDASRDIIARYKDSRITALYRDHAGLVTALNEGIRRAQGTYLARMDADDISLPQRFEKQLAFLRSTGTCICGTQAVSINEQGKEMGFYDVPLSYTAIRKYAFLHNPFIHPTVMAKKEVIQAVGGYRAKFKHTEDYDLWTRIIPQYRVGNMEERLLKYRIAQNSVTRSHQLAMRTQASLIRLQYVSKRLRYVLKKPRACTNNI